jgi:myotubularin-related protein 1/2
MVAGKGTEDISEYTNTELVFCNIENIHVMRGSLSSLAEIIFAGNDNDINFNAKVEETGWLRHLSLLLSSSLLAAEKIHLEEATVLNHCSDGFDRTSQTCSLTQILLDPYYRTIEGLACLIEKDWCAFGHKFKDRCGHGLDFNVTPDERSPVFLQFLDAVHQIIIQFPSVFEYNINLLVYIADHSTSGLYGNFIGNSYRQRMVELRVQECTQSIWTVVFNRRDIFSNVSYKQYNGPIWPSCSLKKIRLWERYFLRWDPACHPNGIDDDAWVDSWDDAPTVESMKDV